MPLAAAGASLMTLLNPLGMAQTLSKKHKHSTSLFIISIIFYVYHFEQMMQLVTF